MKLIEKIAFFFNRLFGRNTFKNNKLLTEGVIEENIDFDSISIKNEVINESEKKEFFRVYQAYKDGKINPDKILITDLIKIEMMMEEESMMLKRKIENTHNEIERQNEILKNLVSQLPK